MNALERLLNKRKRLRELTLVIMDKISTELAKDDENCQVNELQTLLPKLVEPLNGSIEPQITDDNQYQEEIDAIEEWDEKFIEIMKSIELRIQRLSEVRGPSSSCSTTSSGSRKSKHVKLPRMTIEKFDGDACKWQDFWAQFSISVHDDEDLDSSVKFAYLKQYLSGQAMSAIQGLPVTEANYVSAIKILKQRFGKIEVIKSAHLNKLLRIPLIKKANDIVALRKLYDNCEIQIRSLESLEIKPETFEIVFCDQLLQNLPEEITLQFTRTVDDQQAMKAEQLLTFLRKEVESREKAYEMAQAKQKENSTTIEQPKNKSTTRFPQEKNSKSHPTTLTLHANVKPESNESKGCFFCNKQDHKHDECVDLSYIARKEALKKCGRCFICIRAGHMARDCGFRNRIKCRWCGKHHDKVVCPTKYPEPITEEKNKNVEEKSDGNNSTKMMSAILKLDKNVYLQTACVEVISEESTALARCLLDNGAQRTFVSTKLSRALKLPILGNTVVAIDSFEGQEPKLENRNVVLLTLRSTDGTRELTCEALETPRISSSLLEVPNGDIMKTMETKGLRMADNPTEFPDVSNELNIQLASDFYWKIVKGPVIRLTDSLCAVDTIFGWTINGPLPATNFNVTVSTVRVMKVVVHETEMSVTNTILKSFWEMESMGIVDDPNQETPAELEAMEFFNSTIKRKDGRYEVRLPWKQNHRYLLDNYVGSKKRLYNLMKQLESNTTLLERYQAVLEDYLERGIIERVEKNNYGIPGETFYLPHRGLERLNRISTKLRVVFDGSSHEKNSPSLNDCLHAGKNLNPGLLGILVNFRKYLIALMSDIEKAFLQIGLAPEDRDVTRFLWFEGDLKTRDEIKIIVYRMTRVLFGVTSSPFLLAATIKAHLKVCENEYPEACKLINESLYVDDLLGGAHDVEQAFLLSTDAEKVLREAKMPLCKWQTNSNDLRERWREVFPNETLDKVNMNFQQAPGPIKVLGITWVPETDTFKFDVDSLLEFLLTRKNTKRYILQAYSRIFDPIGFLSPFTIRVKCLYQSLWLKGVEWDEELNAEIIMKWNEWCSELHELNRLIIPRCYTTGPKTGHISTQIHCFCDSSEQAFGAVVYLRTESQDKIDVSLVASKTRVAPLESLKIPRLELLGALVGARLTKKLSQYFKEEEPSYHFWTDSMATYHWIKGPANDWKPFVANRLAEIHTLTEPESWYFIRGKDNPADLLTRGIKVSKLIDSEKWWTGPEFLKKPETDWPKNSKPTTRKQVVGELEEELRPNRTFQATLRVRIENTPVFDLAKYSSLMRPLRITSWIMRFFHNLRNKDDKIQGPLTVEETTKAERYWIKFTQTSNYLNEIQDLKSNTPLEEDSKIKNLNPFLDQDDLLRVGGRLQESEFSYSKQHPIILPESHQFTKLQVNHCHEKVFHLGVASTLTQIRENYWIPKGRQLVKSLISRCLICRKLKAMPATQVMAPLPRERINEALSFQVTGVDFMGPLLVKAESENTQHKKVYIALFTCAVTRAIHLELVTDLSASKFILSLKRFISRRGLCTIVFSDNAKTFKKTCAELENLWKKIWTKELMDYFSTNQITWKFNTERAPWRGGFFERQVGTVKNCLKKSLGKAELNYEELETVIIEIEAAINSRPITYTTSDSDEPAPLTPSHFLIGRRLNSLPPKSMAGEKISCKRTELNRRWMYRETLMNRFWQRWRCEYLLELRSAHQKPVDGKTPSNLKPGDVVLISENRQPRHLWTMGRIIEVYEGRDGKIRSCLVKTPKSDLKRPVQLLYPLELDLN